MTNAITLDKGLKLQVLIAPPPKSKTLEKFGPIEDVNLYVDMTPMVIGFRYYESITQLFVQAELDILDNTNQIKNIFENKGDQCGIRKYCAVKVFFPDPLTDATEGTIQKIDVARNREALDFGGDKIFYISKVENVNAEASKKYYTIQLIEKSAIVNAHKRIISAYSGKLNEIIRNVVKTNLYSPLPVLDDSLDNPGIVAKYLAQNIRISDVIDYLCKKAQTTKLPGTNMNSPQQIVGQNTNVSTAPFPPASNTGTSKPTPSNNIEVDSTITGYTFYQTYDGFNFSALYKLITPKEENDRKIFSYLYTPLNSEEGILEASLKILSFSENERENSSSALQSAQAGTTGNQLVNNYDPLSGKSTTIQFVVLKNPCDTYAFEPDTNATVYNTILQEFDNQSSNNCNETPIIKSLALRRNYDAVLEYIRSNTTTVLVPGNLSLQVGDYIRIYRKGSEAEVDPNIRTEYDLYLIYSLCHRVSDINKVYTDLLLCKIKKDLKVE